MSKAEAKEAVRVGDAAVRAGTGKTWQQWFKLLDAAGARTMDHRGIVACLRAERVGPWWGQMVAAGDEQARGLRKRHEKPSGFEISVSKTIAVPLPAVYEAWSDEKSRRRWLKEKGLNIRKATPDKSMRITWVDGSTNLNVDFYDKGPGKSQVTVQHGKLADATQAAAMKTYWAEALNRLQAALHRA